MHVTLSLTEIFPPFSCVKTPEYCIVFIVIFRLGHKQNLSHNTGLKMQKKKFQNIVGVTKKSKIK